MATKKGNPSGSSRSNEGGQRGNAIENERRYSYPRSNVPKPEKSVPAWSPFVALAKERGDKR